MTVFSNVSLCVFELSMSFTYFSMKTLIFFSLQLFFKLFIYCGCARSSVPCKSFLQLQRVGTCLSQHRLQGFSVAACSLSRCSSGALEHRLSSRGTLVSLFCSMWNLPGIGTEPMSPELEGRCLTTGSPGKSFAFFFFLLIVFCVMQMSVFCFVLFCFSQHY